MSSLIEVLKLAQIRTDGGTQPRTALNDDTVGEYGEAITEGASFPAVTVFHDGSDYWLADGFHRFFAHKKIGMLDIQADVRQGTKRDAILYSIGANAAHGLRRTNGDKRKAVLTLLEDSEWAKWSDREIARICHVGNQLVGDVRRSLCDSHSDKPVERSYTTKHGTEAVMNTSNIGAKKQSEPVATQPSIDQESLRTPVKATPDARQSELASLQEQLDEANATCAELAMDLEAAQINASDDKDDQVRTLIGRLHVAESQRDQYMEKCNQLIKQNKQLQRVIDKLEGGRRAA